MGFILNKRPQGVINEMWNVRMLNSQWEGCMNVDVMQKKNNVSCVVSFFDQGPLILSNYFFPRNKEMKIVML